MAARYRFISDPGHGWLEVPTSELDSLGIAHLISSCSYTNGAFVYLEEDCDLAVFFVATYGRIETRGDAVAVFWEGLCDDLFQENTFVRRLPSFVADPNYNFHAAMAYCFGEPKEATA